jgi:hypothetical protein
LRWQLRYDRLSLLAIPKCTCSKIILAKEFLLRELRVSLSAARKCAILLASWSSEVSEGVLRVLRALVRGVVLLQ